MGLRCFFTVVPRLVKVRMEMRGLLDTKEQQLTVLRQTASIDARQLASANLRLEDVACKVSFVLDLFEKNS